MQHSVTKSQGNLKGTIKKCNIYDYHNTTSGLVSVTVSVGAAGSVDVSEVSVTVDEVSFVDSAMNAD